jgi:hypothetical protein
VSLSGDAELITIAATGNLANPSPAIVERHGSYYVRDLSLLRSHLETTNFDFGKVTSGAAPSAFFVSITVEADGDVQSVQGSTPALASRD